MQLLKKAYNRIRPFFMSKEKRREIWPPAKKLSARHIQNCKLIEDRYKMLHHIPEGGICAELGIWKAEYSKEIMRVVKPAELHLVDITANAILIANSKLKHLIEDGIVELHHKDSVEMLESMPDHFFDWIYIDADHSYEGVKRDLQAAHEKIKPDGLISLNDYIFFGPSDLTKYGVVEAVNEFCIDYAYEFVHFALHGRMYNDVTIRQIR